MQFAPAHSRIKQDKQCTGCRQFWMSDTIIDKLLFFLISKRAAFLALMFGKYDLCHRGIEFIIACGKVENTAQDKLYFLGSTQFVLFHIAEQKSLDKLSVYLGECLAGESRGDIVFKQPLVFFESERLCRFLFEGKPVLCKVVEEYGVPALCFHAARCRVVVERVNELLFQGL